MVDFKKLLGLESIEKKVDPIELYEVLDRRSEAGPLRPVQNEILNEWWLNRKEEKDLILKLHTGQGKTLIGLLILQSRLNENMGPCLFICPNKYLVKQTCQEADKFGIGYTVFGEDNVLPDEFLNSNKILITHVQKVFNGKSIFGVGGTFTKVNTLILDDSHACIDFINDSCKVVVDSTHQIYIRLLELFEEDLREQGEGSYFEIKSGEYNTLLPVPYWSWQDKKSDVLKILVEYINDHKLMFTWPLIKNSIDNCRCFITGNSLEISTYFCPINMFGTFSNAKHRILMSATTQNDSFFIKGLGLNINAVNNPLVIKSEKWSGEKMVLIPSLIHEELDREAIINRFASTSSNRRVGYLAITPSFKMAKLYETLGSEVARDNIFEAVNKLKNGEFNKMVVIVNRYDGIDLPDDACRILIIDSLPYTDSLTERYEGECRTDSSFINIRVAQKIEQGLGRSVRGEKDYSVILLIGADLIRFVKSSATNKYFSLQTRQQLQIGLQVSEAAKGEQTSGGFNQGKALYETMGQCLFRDPGWKEFYKERMDKNIIPAEKLDSNVLGIMKLEYAAEEHFYKNEPEKAITAMQGIVDSYFTDNLLEKGWYLQELARYKYKISKVDSNQTQKSAYKNNLQLLKPKDGISYQKLSYISENRVKRVNSWISSHKSYQELILNLNGLMDDLSFGQPSDKFERALQTLGSALGFLSQRPDKEFKKGPDNLWCVSSDDFFIFECKSEVNESRTEITKLETGQMNNHCAWFEQEYLESKVKRILVIRTRSLSNQANFTHSVEVMRMEKLRLLKDRTISFFKEFKDYILADVTDQTIQSWLVFHELDVESLKNKYSEAYTQRR